MPARRNIALNLLRLAMILAGAALATLWRLLIPAADQKLEISQHTVAKLSELRDRAKYVDTPGTMYNGMRPESLRSLAQEQLNRLIDRLRDGLPSKPSKKFALAEFAKTMAEFEATDTEDREQLLRYLEELMDILGIASSDGLLNRWMYGPVLYRGEKFRLSKKYVDYDDYKNDTGNVAPSEIPRIERMMTEARIGPDFADWKAFVDQAFKIKFPGYGMGPGPKVAAGGREFIVEVIEIPQVAKDRYFVLEKMRGGALRLVDDFVTPRGRRSAFWAVSSVRLVDDRLVYADQDSKVVRETFVAPQP
jgi:hypothetical protein